MLFMYAESGLAVICVAPEGVSALSRMLPHRSQSGPLSVGGRREQDIQVTGVVTRPQALVGHGLYLNGHD